MPLAVNGMKICPYKTCHAQGKPQPVEDFYKNKNSKDGCSYGCRECEKAAYKDWAQRQKSPDYKRRVTPQEKLAAGKKICPHCKDEKKLDEFNVERSSPDGRQTYCRDCDNRMAREKRAKHRQTRPRKKRGYPRKWYGPCLPNTQFCYRCGRMLALTEFHKNATQCKECSREVAHAQYVARSPEVIEKERQKYREWCEQNHDKQLAATNRWHAAHPEKALAYAQKREALIKGATPPGELIINQKVYERDNYICYLCNTPILNVKNNASIDHVIPPGPPHHGPHSYANVKTAHKSCNSRKNKHLLSELPPLPWDPPRRKDLR